MGMSRRELLFTLVFAHLLGLGMFFMLSENSSLSLNSLFGNSTLRADSSLIDVQNKVVIAESPSAEANRNILEEATQTATPLSILQGPSRGEDYEDALLMYSESNATLFDQNFCKIVEFYGLTCKRFNLDQNLVTADVLKDFSGEYFKLIGIQAGNLLPDRSLFIQDEIEELRNAVESGSAHLLVSELNEDTFSTPLFTLTDGAVVGVVNPEDATKDWIFSSAKPEITRELTGQVFRSDAESNQHDFALSLGDENSVVPLMSSIDDSGKEYMIFSLLELGEGMLYLDASEPSPLIGKYPMRALLYNTEWFSRLVPMMIAVSATFGDEAWHNDRNFANLMIDNMWLGDDLPGMDYLALLREMQTNNFHTTLGFIPAKWEQSAMLVMSILRANPHLFSIAQYGNNVDGYEFYRYEVPMRDWFAGDPEPARPLDEQAADILEGLERLEMLRDDFGIPYDKIMIFPGMPPEATIGLLKQFNYLATLSTSNVPLGSSRPEYWDYGMYQAILDFENFPILSRRYVKGLETAGDDLQFLLINLFIDKPALMYSSAARLFNGKMDAFSGFADALNGFEGDLQWKSLGFIVRHLFLEKTNDDGGVEIKMYSSNLIVRNNSTEEREYHVIKEETLNFPISGVFVNGEEFPYSVVDDLLQMNFVAPASSEVEIEILYEI